MITKIVNKIKEENGFTYSLLTGEFPKSGYAVSLKDHEQKIKLSGEATLASLGPILGNYIKKNIEKLLTLDSFYYVGGWIDDNTLYLDISTIRMDRLKAERLGKKNEQISIFDLENKKEIKLDYGK